jgi:hypothetical protein
MLAGAVVFSNRKELLSSGSITCQAHQPCWRNVTDVPLNRLRDTAKTAIATMCKACTDCFESGISAYVCLV